jgi:hypothetical protein
MPPAFPPLATNLVNVALYQAGWFCCVLGGAWGYPLSGALAALALTGAHLLLAVEWKGEVRLMLTACLLGITVDSLQQAAGVFAFTRDPAWPLWLPPWVFVIWAQFATLFRYALRWLAGRYLLAALLGMTGGPVAYVAGIRLGAATFEAPPVVAVAVLAVVWSVVTPLLLWFSARGSAGPGRYRWPLRG